MSKDRKLLLSSAGVASLAVCLGLCLVYEVPFATVSFIVAIYAVLLTWVEMS